MASSDKLFEIYQTIRGRLTRLVVGIVPPKDVEDIVQETYVRVCQIDNKDTIRQPQSFMFRTAQNLALNHIKRAEYRLTEGVDAIDELGALPADFMQDGTYAQVTSDEQFALFCEAVRHLPQQCRRAYVLKKVYGYTLREIAAEMGLSESTVEKHVVAGAKKCMQYRREQQAAESKDASVSRRRRSGGSHARTGEAHE